MARPQRIEYPGAFYHITSRGNEKGATFWHDRDRRKFLSLIDGVHQRYKILIHAFVLMHNHYHLLMETPQGNLSKVMHDLNSSYTGFINAIHERVGHLFQGRFKGILVDRDSYLLELSRYIHLNPVRAKIVRSPEEYPWSGMNYFLGKARPPAWMNIDFTLRMFSGSRCIATAAYLEFMHEDVGTTSPLNKTFAQCILGTEGFIAAVKEKYLAADHIGQDVVRAKSLSARTTLDSISALVAAETGSSVHVRTLVHTRKGNLGLRLFVLLAHRYTDRTLGDIAAYVGQMKPNAVAQTIFRIMPQLTQDKALQATMARIEAKLGTCH